MRVLSDLMKALPAPPPRAGEMKLWRVRFRLEDGGVSDVTVAIAEGGDVIRAAIRKLRLQVKFAGKFEVEAKWCFDPPQRWYCRRAGRSMRNAAGALCSLLPLGPQDTPVLCVGILLLSLAVAIALGNWMRGRKAATMGKRGDAERQTEWARASLKLALVSPEDAESFLEEHLDLPRICPCCDSIASSKGACWCCGFESGPALKRVRFSKGGPN
jgi:hypothetical protein